MNNGSVNNGLVKKKKKKKKDFNISLTVKKRKFQPAHFWTS